MGCDYCVYFIKAGEYIKIGCSVNVDNRVNKINADNPYDAIIIGVYYYEDDFLMRMAEHYFHTLFRNYHFNGEWFWYKPIIKWLYSSYDEQVQFYNDQKIAIDATGEDEFLPDGQDCFPPTTSVCFISEYVSSVGLTDERIEEINKHSIEVRET